MSPPHTCPGLPFSCGVFPGSRFSRWAPRAGALIPVSISGFAGQACQVASEFLLLCGIDLGARPAADWMARLPPETLRDPSVWHWASPAAAPFCASCGERVLAVHPGPCPERPQLTLPTPRPLNQPLPPQVISRPGDPNRSLGLGAPPSHPPASSSCVSVAGSSPLCSGSFPTNHLAVVL